MKDNTINLIDVFSSQAIDGSGTVYSAIIDLDVYRPNGFLGIQVESAGASSVIKLGYQVANENLAASMSIPEGKDGTAVDEIVTAHAPGAIKYYEVSPVIARYIRFYATETAGNPVTSLDAKLAIQ